MQISNALAPNAPLHAMAAYSQFILWMLAERNGKQVKLPVDHRTGLVADAHNTDAWTDADTAIEAANAYGAKYGVGFVFSANDPFFFVDLDKCLEADGKTWSPVAMDVMQRLSGAAVEVSQSGRGLHIFGQGMALDHACKNVPLGLEFYTEGRFVALTGTNAIGNANSDHTEALISLVADYFPPNSSTANASAEWTTEPVAEWSGPESDDKLIEKMLAAKGSPRSQFGGNASVTQLWNGDSEALADCYPDPEDKRAYDASSADAALCSHLAFWTGKNCGRMDRLFRRSSLYRNKWESRPDYRHRTITSAAAQCTNVYQTHPQPVQPTGAVSAVTYRSGPQLLAATQQAEHFSGCVYMRDRNRVFTPDGDQLDRERFNATYGGYDYLINTEGKTTRKAWEAFTESQSVSYPWAHGPCFRPEIPAGEIVTDGGRRLVNVYVDAQGERLAGDVTPFLQHVERLLPNANDRETFLSYLAACVQRPGAKFQWCVVMQGAEGNGKTVFYHVLAYALGERYAHLPNAAEITNPFNAWIEQKLIIGIEEVHTQGRQEVADTLKPMITNSRMEIHGKGQDQRTGDNRANFIMFSNHKDAVLKTENDRRYCVFYTAQQEPGDLERDGMDGNYFAALYDWFRAGGYSHVAHYLASRAVTIDVMSRAPVTSSTAEAVRSSLGVAEQLIAEAIDLEEYGFRNDLICTKAASEHLKANGKKLSPQKVAAALANLGYIKHPALDSSDGKISIGGIRRRLYTKRGSLTARLPTSKAVGDAWRRSQGAVSPSFSPAQPVSVFSEPPKAP